MLEQPRSSSSCLTTSYNWLSLFVCASQHTRAVAAGGARPKCRQPQVRLLAARRARSRRVNLQGLVGCSLLLCVGLRSSELRSHGSIWRPGTAATPQQLPQGVQLHHQLLRAGVEHLVGFQHLVGRGFRRGRGGQPECLPGLGACMLCMPAVAVVVARCPGVRWYDLSPEHSNKFATMFTHWCCFCEVRTSPDPAAHGQRCMTHTPRRGTHVHLNPLRALRARSTSTLRQCM